MKILNSSRGFSLHSQTSHPLTFLNPYSQNLKHITGLQTDEKVDLYFKFL